jgi:hypothetical protein
MVLKTSVFLILHFAYFFVFYIISFFRLINLYNHFYIYSPAICLYIHFLNISKIHKVGNSGKEGERNERNDEEHGEVCEEDKTGSEC